MARGFASLSPELRVIYARLGGKAVQRKGSGHSWKLDRVNARLAGRKGGLASRASRAQNEGRMNNAAMFSSATDEWATPQDFFDALNEEFHFSVDLAASPENAKCFAYYTVA
jgi:general stress protein YciG